MHTKLRFFLQPRHSRPVTPSLNFCSPLQLATILNDLTNEKMPGTKISAAITVGQKTIYYAVQLVLYVGLLSKGISVILGIAKISKKPFPNSLTIRQPSFIKLTTMEIRFPCTSFRTPFLLFLLVTPFLRNWVLLAFNNARKTIELNRGVKVSPLRLTKHFSICLPCFVILTIQLFVFLKLSLFSHRWPLKPST